MMENPKEKVTILSYVMQSIRAYGKIFSNLMQHFEDYFTLYD
jgi:hypothetical protein